MKYTNKNIRGLTLWVIEKETGELFQGSFYGTNGVFDVYCNSKTDYIMFVSIENLITFNRIDGAYNNRNEIFNKGYLLHHELEFAAKNNGNGTTPFLIFSTEEKAKYVLKHFIIPVLIKERVGKADEIMKLYLDYTQDVDRLENILKEL